MTVGSEILSLASASNLPTDSYGHDQVDSPERTTPDKMSPFAASADSPERTGTGDVFGGGCGGSGDVGHAPDLYEFLSGVGGGAGGAGKKFPVDGDSSTMATTVSGRVRFAAFLCFWYVYLRHFGVKHRFVLTCFFLVKVM